MNTQSAKKFFSPLLRPTFVAVVLLVSFILAGAFTCAQIVIENRVQRASVEVLFLANEFNKEAGPHFAEEQKMHARMLREFTTRMESRAPTALFARLLPKYSPRIQLQEAMNILVSPQHSEMTSSNAIKQAANLLAETGKLWSKAGQPAWVLRGSKSSEAAEIVQQVQAGFEKSLDDFKNDHSVRTAEFGCMNSRLAIAAVVSHWPELTRGKNDTRVQQLTARLESLREEMLLFAKTLPAEEKHRIEHYAGNVDGRLTVLTQLARGGLPAAQEALLTSLAQR